MYYLNFLISQYSVKYLTYSFLITEIAPNAKDVKELKRLRDALSSNVREEAFKKAQEVQTKIDKVEEKISSSTKIFQGKRFAVNILKFSNAQCKFS